MSNQKLLLNNQLCFRLYTASRLITQAYEPYFRPLGITYTQYLVLLVLWEEDHLPIHTIASKLKLGLNTLSPLMKRMEAMGLIERTLSREDKRMHYATLTQKGKQMQQEANNIPDCMLSTLEGCNINAAELTAIAPILDELINKLGDREK